MDFLTPWSEGQFYNNLEHFSIQNILWSRSDWGHIISWICYFCSLSCRFSGLRRNIWHLHTLGNYNNGLVTVTIPIMDDTDLEGTEDFYAYLAALNPSPRTTLDPVLATANIMDEDG